MSKEKIIRWSAVVVCAPLLLIFLLTVSLYIPPIQNWAIKKATAYASSATGMDIRIDRIRLSFPLDLGVDGLCVTRQNDSLPQVRDTIVNARKLVVDVKLLPLFNSNVEIDKLDFNGVKVNTSNLIKSACIKGYLKRLTLESHGIDLKHENLCLDKAMIDKADVDVALNDTVPEDTTKTPTYWNISVGRLQVARSGVTIHMPGDTLRVYAGLGRVDAHDGHFDLFKNKYTLRRLSWKLGSVRYDNTFKQRTKGLDYNHISLSDISLGVDSLDYSPSGLSLVIKPSKLKEKSGINISTLSGKVQLDSTHIQMPDLIVGTPESKLNASISLDFNTFDEKSPGKMNVVLDASLGKQDIMRFLGNMPRAFTRRWPNRPLTINGVAKGNMKCLDIGSLLIKLPTAFTLRANGKARNLTDMKRLQADIAVQADTYNMDFATALMGNSANSVRLPQGMHLKGKINADGTSYAANFLASAGGGNITGNAHFNATHLSYSAMLNASKLPLAAFLPGSGLRPFSGRIEASGTGFDILSPTMKLDAKAEATSMAYAGYDMSGMKLTANVGNGVGHAILDSHNKLLTGTIGVSTLLSRKKLNATINCDIAKADFYSLKLTKNPLTASVKANVSVESDLKQSHDIKGLVNDITISDSARSYHPENIVLDVFTRPDTTHAAITCGDFALRLNANDYYDKLLRHADDVMAEIQKQASERYIDQLRIRHHLPLMSLYVNSGKENVFCRALKHYGYEVKSMHIDMNTSPIAGLNGSVALDSLVTSGIQLDTIRLAFSSDSTTTHFEGKVRNSPGNPQYVFNAKFRGAIFEQALYLGTQVYDADERLGVALGIRAAMEQNGIRINLGGVDPVLGYKKFSVNKGNYVFLADDSRISADMKLRADDGMGIQVYTNDSTEALQDVTIGLTKFDLAKVLSVIPYTPDVSGIMNGDFHLINMPDGELSVSSSVNVDNMIYEKCPIGNIGTEFVYMPKDGGKQHYVDGTLSCNDYEVCALNGFYDSEGVGNLSAKLTLDNTPLLLLNGFVPDQLISFKGSANGHLTVDGTLSRPNVNGEICFDSAYIASVPYGVELLLCDDPVTVTGSHLLFENFEMYAHNGSPLNLYGYFDFSDMERMRLDMKVRATDYLLIDSKENSRSEAYGKAYVNFLGVVKGPLESLSMRGKLDVLGSTDLTYILRDSPLTTDNQMNDLVKFVNFRDPDAVTVTRPPLTGLDVDLTMSIDQGAHILCALNTDKSNYVDLIGGGDLRMQYNTTDNLQLSGRYTLNNGEMKYSLPVIPLKTFVIQDGSYIEFFGDPMNPRLNITATEQTKATVSTDGGSGRSVAFECGVVISKTLSNMGLQFVIDAPDDQTIHNELQTMSAEKRGKIAVTMLTTGMYISDGNVNSFSMNSALSAFLNSQINAISGNALRTLDLSFGMDNTTLGSGSVHTDYSFKFSKRFWNNRLRIVVGGKVSSGAEVENQNNTFFDNVTFEYRMNATSNKYLKLFYERDSYDWLEGNVSKFGGGFMWRRKLQHFRDIFRFKSESATIPAEQNDTTTEKKKDEAKDK